MDGLLLLCANVKWCSAVKVTSDFDNSIRRTFEITKLSCCVIILYCYYVHLKNLKSTI